MLIHPWDAASSGTVLVHLARPNKVWPAIEARPTVVMSVIDDYAYIPPAWRAKAGGPDEDGVPTSYYSAAVRPRPSRRGHAPYGRMRDGSAAAKQRRRPHEIGEWKPRR